MPEGETRAPGRTHLEQPAELYLPGERREPVVRLHDGRPVGCADETPISNHR